MSKKQIILFAVVIIVICLGVFLFVYTQSHNSSLTWERYTTAQIKSKQINYISQNLGISFQYPADFFIIENKDNVTITSIAPNDPRRQSDAMMGALAFYKETGKTVEQIIATYKQDTLSSREVVVNGLNGIELISKPDAFAGSTWITILIKTDRDILVIKYMKNTAFDEAYQSIIQNIQIEQGQIVDWKEYTDAMYGVVIKYPNDWSPKAEVVNGGEVSGVTFKQDVVRLTKDSRVLVITLTDSKTDLSGGGTIVNNLSDYISFTAINTLISRSTIPEQSEIGHQKYLYVCRIQTNSKNTNGHGVLCDNPILINNVYFGFNYLLNTEDTSDSSIVKEMDTIVQNISIK